LLRAKAISLFYCHPRCPILTALAARFLDLTSGVKPIFSKNYWDLQMSTEAKRFSDHAQSEFELGITLEDREDFSRLYGVDVHTQIGFETYVSGVGLNEELDHWSIDEMLKEHAQLRQLRTTHTL
jgi:hypothetical protein